MRQNIIIRELRDIQNFYDSEAGQDRLAGILLGVIMTLIVIVPAIHFGVVVV